MKNQGENKKRHNTFHSREFIHFIADLLGRLSIFHILSSNIYLSIYIYYISISIYISIYIYIEIYIYI